MTYFFSLLGMAAAILAMANPDEAMLLRPPISWLAVSDRTVADVLGEDGVSVYIGEHEGALIFGKSYFHRTLLVEYMNHRFARVSLNPAHEAEPAQRGTAFFVPDGDISESHD